MTSKFITFFKKVQDCGTQAIYRPLLKRMQLTCTAWVDSFNIPTDGRGKASRSCQKHQSLAVHYLLSIGRQVLGISFVTPLKSNLFTARTI